MLDFFMKYVLSFTKGKGEMREILKDDVPFWQKGNVVGRDDLNIRIEIFPISHRARNRVQEHGKFMILKRVSHTGPFKDSEEQIFVSSLGGHWTGWFRNGTDIEFELT